MQTACTLCTQSTLFQSSRATEKNTLDFRSRKLVDGIRPFISRVIGRESISPRAPLPSQLAPHACPLASAWPRGSAGHPPHPPQWQNPCATTYGPHGTGPAGPTPALRATQSQGRHRRQRDPPLRYRESNPPPLPSLHSHPHVRARTSWSTAHAHLPPSPPHRMPAPVSLALVYKTTCPRTSAQPARLCSPFRMPAHLGPALSQLTPGGATRY
jgi:hypothetical protein